MLQMYCQREAQTRQDRQSIHKTRKAECVRNMCRVGENKYSLQASNDTATITGAINFAHLERRCPMNDEEAADFDAPAGICEHDVVTGC